MRKVAKNVLKALKSLHSQDKVHSDISPQNIYRVQGDKGKDIFKLGDFGKIKRSENDAIKKMIFLLWVELFWACIWEKLKTLLILICLEKLQ